MKSWKVILATLVIFIAGIVTGAMLSRHATPPDWLRNLRLADGSRTPWSIQRPEFFMRMKSELDLTPEQTEKVASIIRKSQQRTEPLWELIGPLLQEEMGKVRNELKAELNMEQRVKFEELLKPRPIHRPGFDSHRGTNRPPHRPPPSPQPSTNGGPTPP